MSSIPVENVYYLLIYAWDRLPEAEQIDIAALDRTSLVNLYASVLLQGMRHLMRRGLEQSYIAERAEIPGIRGRANIAITARRMLAVHGKAFCEFDELSIDTTANQILVSTLYRLSASPELDRELREAITTMLRKLRGISRVELQAQLFRRVQFHRNNGFYRFLLNVCELAFESSIATEEAGRYRFRDFLREPERMASLFERFILNFARRERRDAVVKSDRIIWDAGSDVDPELAFLPTMNTDISVRWPGRTLIIDAKFYQDTLRSKFGVSRVHSGHLYQLYSYLRNLEPRGGADREAEGMLLYPQVDTRLRLKYQVPGHCIRICTLDLSQDWRSVRNELQELLS